MTLGPTRWQRLKWLRTHSQGNGRTGVIGFFAGAAPWSIVLRVADPRLDAGSMFYGSAPDASGAAQIRARLLLNYGELDERIKCRHARMDSRSGSCRC